jgi:D-aminopeptidase
MSPNSDTWNQTPEGLPRARGLGLPFDGQPGLHNSLTDVPGVQVGFRTLIEGTGGHIPNQGPVRTGVTVIFPRGRSDNGVSCPAAVFSSNGNGELTGSHWIEEAGSLSTPIAITNTHAVGSVHRALVDWISETNPAIAAQWQLPVVAETWDGFLNDINGNHVSNEHVREAIASASDGPVLEGSVGGGTGMNCYGFKGGTGTASRLVSFGGTEYTVASLLQCNFGSRAEFKWNGVELGKQIEASCQIEQDDWLYTDRRTPPGAGSVIAVIATDAPLLPAQLKAMARRVPFGLARTGTSGSHFSGDIFLAFSTANPGSLDSIFPDQEPAKASLRQLNFVPWGYIDPFYEAVVQCVEESVLNALVANRDMTGRNDHFSPAVPHDQLLRLLAE